MHHVDVDGVGTPDVILPGDGVLEGRRQAIGKRRDMSLVAHESSIRIERAGRLIPSGVDANEMEHGVAVDDGGVLYVLDITFVFQIGIGQRQLTRAVCLREHAFELDFR